MNQCPFPILAMVFNFGVQKILEFSRIDLQMRGRTSSKLVYLGTPNSLKRQDHPKDSEVCRNYSDRSPGE